MDLTSRGSVWITLGTPRVFGLGRVQPRLEVVFPARTLVREIDAQVIQLEAEAILDGDRVGIGTVREMGKDFHYVEGPLTMEVPLSSQAIAFIEDHFREASLHLQFQWRGTLRVRQDDDIDGSLPSVPIGEWQFLSLDSGSNRGTVTVSRSDWAHNVLAPMGVGDFVVLVMPVPQLPNPEMWQVAVDHVHHAEEQFRHGNDPGVFHHCFAAFERFRGSPNTLFPQIDDSGKREKVNALLKQLNTYFQAGRHTSKGGPQEGQFAVDHRDAEAALAFSKVFLAYIAKLNVE